MANKENSGALFDNAESKTSEKAPDYSGTANVNGVEVKIAGWIQEGQNGKKGFLSLKFTPEGQTQAPQQKQNTGYSNNKPAGGFGGGRRF